MVFQIKSPFYFSFTVEGSRSRNRSPGSNDQCAHNIYRLLYKKQRQACDEPAGDNFICMMLLLCVDRFFQIIYRRPVLLVS